MSRSLENETKEGKQKGEKIPFVSDIARTTVCVIMTATLDPFMDGRQLERAQPGIRCRHRKRKKKQNGQH